MVRDIADERSLLMSISPQAFKKAIKCKQTAEMIYHFRNFHEACDCRGLTAEERIRHLVEVYNYLTAGLNFDQITGQDLKEIKGIPFVTYESILCNISTRIRMFGVCSNGSYNARAFSSLAVESFFSLLARSSQNDCPRSVNIPNMMAGLVELNAARHMSSEELGFEYHPFNRGVYSFYKQVTEDKRADEQEAVEETVDTEPDPCFPNHNFDKIIKKKKKKRHKHGHLSNNLAPLHGVRPVRTNYFKIDESKINELNCQGILEQNCAAFEKTLAAVWNMPSIGDGEVTDNESDMEL